MQSRWTPAIIPPIIFLLDRVSKVWIESRVSFYDTYIVIPGFFSIVHTQNKGAAFGILSEASGTWRNVFLIGVSLAVMGFVAVLLIVSLRHTSSHSGWLRAGLALVLGGALGNLWDRVLRGSVTDFLLFYAGQYQWPAFNVADSAISVGAAFLLLDMLHERRRASAGVPRVS
jgi:signal peptidase II